MKIKQAKNRLLIPLSIITAVIWGIIIYNIVDYYNSLGTDKTDVIDSPVASNQLYLEKPTDNKLLNTDYIKLDRDPFVLGARKRNTVAVRTNKESSKPKSQNNKKIKSTTAPVPLNYLIKGVVINDTSKLVIFQDMTNKKTLFMRERETYLGIIIKEINATKILLNESGSEKEINVKN